MPGTLVPPAHAARLVMAPPDKFARMQLRGMGNRGLDVRYDLGCAYGTPGVLPATLVQVLQARDPAAFRHLLAQHMLHVPLAYCAERAAHHAAVMSVQAREMSCLAQWFVMMRLEVPLEIAVADRVEVDGQVSLVITFTSTAEVWVVDFGFIDEVDQLSVQAAALKKLEHAERVGQQYVGRNQVVCLAAVEPCAGGAAPPMGERATQPVRAVLCQNLNAA